jgi:hypothetical protein
MECNWDCEIQHLHLLPLNNLSRKHPNVFFKIVFVIWNALSWVLYQHMSLVKAWWWRQLTICWGKFWLKTKPTKSESMYMTTISLFINFGPISICLAILIYLNLQLWMQPKRYVWTLHNYELKISLTFNCDYM